MLKRRFSEPILKQPKIRVSGCSDYDKVTGASLRSFNSNQHHQPELVNKHEASSQALKRREKLMTQSRIQDKTADKCSPNKKLKDSPVNVTQLLKRLEVMRNKNSSLKKSIENVKVERDTSMKERAKALEDLQNLRLEKQHQEYELKTAKKTVSSLQKENKNVAQLRSKVEHLQTELNEREHEKKLFTSDLKLANTEQQLQMSEVKRLVYINETLNKEKELKEQFVIKQENRLLMQERLIESLNKQLADMANTQQQKQEFNDDESVRRLEIELKSLLSNQRLLQSENTKQKQEIKDMKAEIEKLDNAKRNLVTQKNEVQDKMASLYLDINRYESAIIELEKNSNIGNAELLAAKEVRNQLEKNNNSLVCEIKEIVGRLQDQQTKILNLNEEMLKNKQLLEVKAANQAHLESITQKLSEENLQLKKEMQQIFQSKVGEVGTLTEVIDNLKKQLSETEVETSAIKRENELLKNKVECLEICKLKLIKDYEEARDKLEQVEKEKLSLTIEKNLSAKEVTELQAEMNDKKTELLCLQQKVNAEKEIYNRDWKLLKNEKEDLIAKNQNLSQKIQQLSAGFYMNFDGLKRRPTEIGENKNLFDDRRNIQWNSSSYCSNSQNMCMLYQNPNLLTVKKEVKLVEINFRAVVGTQTEVDSVFWQELLRNVEHLERRLKQYEIEYSSVIKKIYNLKKINRKKCQVFNSLKYKYKLLVNEHQELQTNCCDLEESNKKLKRDYFGLLDDYEGAKRHVWQERKMKIQLYKDNKIIQEDLNSLKRSFQQINTVLNGS